MGEHRTRPHLCSVLLFIQQPHTPHLIPLLRIQLRSPPPYSRREKHRSERLQGHTNRGLCHSRSGHCICACIRISLGRDCGCVGSLVISSRRVQSGCRGAGRVRTPNPICRRLSRRSRSPRVGSRSSICVSVVTQIGQRI